ncbi:MAG: hypothetical protein ACYC6F_13205 [Longimicrobiales bacterium]
MPIDWEAVAPMIVAVVACITIGGVLVLRPIAKKAGDLMEALARDKQGGLQNDVGQLRDILETMNARLTLMEERLDFTERLMSGQRKPDALMAGEPKKEQLPSGS